MAEYIKEMRELIGSRPFIMVGSTVIVINDKKEILLQHRSDTDEWGLPGGAMEIGESLEQTAERELFEETGLKAENFKFLDVLSGKDFYFQYPNGDEVYNVICVYLAEGTSGVLSINDDESLNLKYFNIGELPPHIDERARFIINKHII
ncbi:NUDIX hydrolase [Metabacillus schmidteae]|uniref:NUDIX hydrolase n=1 Tax=Metabacillus schmidteae TaxID=2730405 RepID=UPI00158BB143|nr:NUDIX hydrolase [Metabacillus schmidteae]